MKKGWKIFWIICAVTAGVGLILCGVSYVMGVTTEEIREQYPEHIGILHYYSDGIYIGSGSNDLDYDASDDDDEDYEDDEDYDVSDDDADDDDADHDDADHDTADKVSDHDASDHDTSDHDTSDHDTSDSEDTQEKVYVSDQDTEIHSIEAEISAGEIHIKASDDEQIQVETKGISKALGLQCKKKGNTLQILSTGTLHKILGNNGTITIYVPKDLLLQDVSLEVGAGNIYIEEMQAKNLEIECGAGNVEYYVTGSQSDYNYEIECGMGNINIDDGKYSGLGQEYDVDNHADRDISIECGMGNVSLYYE